MDLQPSAENEAERRTRSKLESYREAIFTLRRKHWTYGAIAKWLKERGVNITLSSVHRYCQRAVAHRPRADIKPQAMEYKARSISSTETTSAQTGPVKHRFKLDI